MDAHNMDAHIILKFNDTDQIFNDSNVIEANFSLLNASLPANNNYDPVSYFDEYLEIYYHGYRAVHGYLSFIICVFGILTNILNITVLRRKNMVSSTNAILKGLAVADMIYMFLYMPYAYHHYIRNISRKERYSYEWAIIHLFTAHCFFASHAISIWLTVTVVIWQCIAVTFPLKVRSWCSMTRTKYAIAATCVTCAVFYIPNYIALAVREFESREGEIVYVLAAKKIFRQHDRRLQITIFWLYSVFIKFIPCAIIAVLSLGIIRALNETRKKQRKFENRVGSAESLRCTTKMLLIVVLVFLLTQFPQGIMLLLCIFLGADFNNNISVKLSDTFEALCLINCSVNFIIYCIMAGEFRKTFLMLFIPKCIHQQEIVPIANPLRTCYEMRRIVIQNNTDF